MITQGVVAHDELQLVLAEAGHRHRQAIAVVAGALDIVGRVGLRAGLVLRGVRQAGHAVEADRGTEKGCEVENVIRNLQKARSRSGRPEGRPVQASEAPIRAPRTPLNIAKAAPCSRGRPCAVCANNSG